jgi:L-cysteate sulfo-lyase
MQGGRDRSNNLRDRIRIVPRFRLIHAVTPIHELPQLSRLVNRQVFVKRDDLTGLAYGGNKVRQAEFLIGDALEQGADTIVGGGGFIQSNHARVLAAAARAAGLDPVILVRPGRGSPALDMRGNALITRLLASRVEVIEALRAAPADQRLAEVDFRREIFEREADSLRLAGKAPYVVLGSSTPLGVMGYVDAAGEIDRQIRDLGLAISKIFVTSLGATHAGLELGARLIDAPYDVIGFAYQPCKRVEAESAVRDLAIGAASMLGLTPPKNLRILTDVDDAGTAYGVSTSRSRSALRIAAQSDALILDPTYTAKGFAGMLRWIAEGSIPEGEAVLFIHTGGTPGLFARRWREVCRV